MGRSRQMFWGSSTHIVSQVWAYLGVTSPAEKERERD